MPVDPTGGVNNAPTTSTTSTPRDPSILGKDDFLKMLVGQMQNQDPLNPTDGAEYMGQMTQFSILEQMTNMGQTTSASASNQYDQDAIALIGREVSYLRRDGDSLRSYNGRVESVTFTTAGPVLRVSDDSSDVLPVSILNVWGPNGAPATPPDVPDDADGGAGDGTGDGSDTRTQTP
jgi:flagellar basal-body rod modification protein FlgD